MFRSMFLILGSLAFSMSAASGNAAENDGQRGLESDPPRSSNLGPDIQPPVPAMRVWLLARDFKVDGLLSRDRSLDQTSLQLRLSGMEFSGQFLDQKAGEEPNASVFSGQILTREKQLLILRQDDSKDGKYVVIHTGLLVGDSHYRGTWHDNSGQSGDFELKRKD